MENTTNDYDHTFVIERVPYTAPTIANDLKSRDERFQDAMEYARFLKYMSIEAQRRLGPEKRKLVPVIKRVFAFLFRDFRYFSRRRLALSRV
jgi:hypothetical protein